MAFIMWCWVAFCGGAWMVVVLRYSVVWTRQWMYPVDSRHVVFFFALSIFFS